MPEIDSDPLAMYNQLANRHAELLEIRGDAADATVASAIDDGVERLSDELADLRQDPGFATSLLSHLARVATAIDQLQGLRDVLPPDKLEDTIASYTSRACLGLKIADELVLDPEKRCELDELRSRLGDLSVKAAVEVEKALDEDTATKVRVQPPAAEPHPPEPPSKSRADTSPPSPVDKLAQTVTAPEVRPAFLEARFSRRDALVLCKILHYADTILALQCIPRLEPNELMSLLEQLSAQEPDQRAEAEQQEWTEASKRLRELLEDEASLGKILDYLEADDPRLGLLDYLFAGLSYAEQQAVLVLADKQPELLARLADNRSLPDLKPAQEVAPAKLSTEPADSDGLPAQDDKVMPKPGAYDREKTITLCRETISQMRKKIAGTDLNLQDRYGAAVLARGLGIPLAKATTSILNAFRSNLFTGDEPNRQQNNLTVAEFILTQLYTMPHVANLLAGDRVLAEELTGLIAKENRKPA